MRTQGKTIHITGANVDKTAKVLAVRLIELGHNVELIDEAETKSLGGLKSAAHVCELLARNGVIVVLTAPKARVPNSLKIEVNSNDTPDFAAEKILDQLAEEGIVILETPEYTPDDEERIRERLSKLGYIE